MKCPLDPVRRGIDPWDTSSSFVAANSPQPLCEESPYLIGLVCSVWTWSHHLFRRPSFDLILLFDWHSDLEGFVSHHPFYHSTETRPPLNVSWDPLYDFSTEGYFEFENLKNYIVFWIWRQVTQDVLHEFSKKWARHGCAYRMSATQARQVKYRTGQPQSQPQLRRRCGCGCGPVGLTLKNKVFEYLRT